MQVCLPPPVPSGPREPLTHMPQSPSCRENQESQSLTCARPLQGGGGCGGAAGRAVSQVCEAGSALARWQWAPRRTRSPASGGAPSLDGKLGPELGRAVVWRRGSWIRSRQNSASIHTSNKAVLRASVHLTRRPGGPSHREGLVPSTPDTYPVIGLHPILVISLSGGATNAQTGRFVWSLWSASSPPSVNTLSWVWTGIMEEQLPADTSPTPTSGYP